MAENTRLKDPTANVKRILELEVRHMEYSIRFESMEVAVTSLHIPSAPPPIQPF